MSQGKKTGIIHPNGKRKLQFNFILRGLSALCGAENGTCKAK